MFKNWLTISLTTIMICILGCKREENFPDIGTHVSSPTDISVDNTGEYFYVLNSDFDRTYNNGSLLVINSSGEKITAIETPRLGRSINIAGDDLIATFDKQDDDSEFEIHLYDISNRESPALVKRWTSADSALELNCIPVNSVIKENYDHFAVSCSGGRLYLGTLKTPRSDTELKLVRNYFVTRRALHLDVNREVLFAFPTDIITQETEDKLADDQRTIDWETGDETEGPNEVPDDFEATRFSRYNLPKNARRYQYITYPIAQERDKGFPYRGLGNDVNPTTDQELHWLYFTLKNYDGTPDTDAGVTNLNQKHYRTNFWTAESDPFDPNAFYLSHRGKNSKNNRFANSIIKVTILNDTTQTEPKLNNSQLLNFERVYGFSGELNPEQHFPGDFEVKLVNNRLTLLVNHFKDRASFRNSASYTVSAKTLDGTLWSQEISSSSPDSSYFQVAMNKNGKVLAGSFYGNAVIPLEVLPGADIKLGWGNSQRIE